MTCRDLVCACEDVTVADVRAALGAGHTDVESLKRFTGLGTGICQGRSCMPRAAALLAREGRLVGLQPMTARPPLGPVRLGHLACGGPLPEVFPGPHAPALRPAPPVAAPPAGLPPLPKEASVVIVGGGIMGLATAYHLTRLGQRGVVVLEQAYLNAGASGRNGGGIRAQWSTAHNVELMQESLAACRTFAHDLGINIWLRQGGYLFLARHAAHVEALERNVALQNRLGVATRLLTARQCLSRVPGLTCEDVLAASYNADDGVIFPWPFLWGYAERAKRQGAHIAAFTRLTDIELQDDRVVGVGTTRGRIACDTVVNAAAAWSTEVAAMAGVRLPSHPVRHEILVTESLRPFLGPLVTEMDSGLYFSQSLRGEIVAGMGDAQQPAGLEMRSSLRFAVRLARALCARLPALSHVQLVRQWAGCYDVTPDGNPLVGWHARPRGLFALSGFVGHGFMMAPAVSRHVAAYLRRGAAHALMQAWRPGRFDEPDAVLSPETLIIG